MKQADTRTDTIYSYEFASDTCTNEA